MAETVTSIQQAPDYLKPGIERFLEGATAQAGQAMDTSKFARPPSFAIIIPSASLAASPLK